MPKVMLYERVPDAWFDGFAAFLREHQPDDFELELIQPEDELLDSMLSLVPEADVLVVGLTGQRRAVVRHVFEEAVRLKLLQKLGSRAFGVDLEAARDAGVAVSLLSAPAHVACAEHTLMLMLAATKKLLPATRAAAQAAGSDARPGTDDAHSGYNWADIDGIGLLAGKTLGLIGMGDIGVEVAWRAAAFDMDILYYDEEALPEDEAEEMGVTFSKLDDLLIDSDVVSIHIACTPKTENLLNAERLALMKPTAMFVNTARGGIVDEKALAKALREGNLAGAAIDAWATEPPSKLNPLLTLDNVLATPHVAAGTLPPTANFEAVFPNIIAALRGEPIAGLLTPPIIPEKPQGEPESEERPTEDGETPPEAMEPEAGEEAPEPAEGEDTEKEEDATAKEAMEEEHGAQDEEGAEPEPGDEERGEEQKPKDPH